MIGGATTSRVHTAVKIHPNYGRSQAIHVNDASRAVGVAGALMSSERRGEYVAGIRAEYVRIADAHARNEEQKRRVPLAAARANALKLDWSGYRAVPPRALGNTVVRDVALAELVPYIDWSPFFSTWELTGRFPAILDDDKFGAAARALYDDARAMLDRIVAENWFTARGVVGLWPANADGDDILVYADEARAKPIATLRTLRQQLARRDGRPIWRSRISSRRARAALRIMSAPSSSPPASARTRSPTASAAPTTITHPSWSRRSPTGLRKPSRSGCTPRCAANSGAMRRRESLAPHELLAETYAGIRPAPGYPAQPDHSEKATLFPLLDGEAATGVTLTESFAMWPGASVCGLYFGHPQSHYFGVGKIERDQVEDYARRKGWSPEEAERWLAPVLNYDPVSLSWAAAE